MPCDDDCPRPCLKEVKVQSKGLKLNCVDDVCHVIPAQWDVEAVALLVPDLLLSLEFAGCPGLELPMSTQSQKWVTGLWKWQKYVNVLFKDMLVSGQKQNTLFSAALTYCWPGTWQMASTSAT